MRIAIFSAFPQELKQTVRNLRDVKKFKKNPFTLLFSRYSSNEIILAQTGMGTGNAEAALKYILEKHPPDIIASIGFGGALYPGAVIGELVRASKVLLISGNAVDVLELPNVEIFSKIHDRIAMRKGSIVTLEQWMNKSEIKKVLPQELLFPVCDTETYPLAKLSIQRGLPFLAVRSITDRTDEDIPTGLLGVTDGSGDYRLSRAVKVLLRNPNLIPAGIRLGINSRRASKNLWRAVRSLIEIL